MIKKYEDILNKELIEDMMKYLKFVLEKELWGSSSAGWDQNLSSISSNIITHKILDKNLVEKIKNKVEKILQINFDEKKLNFVPSLYIWNGGSYITWHEDEKYEYNGTIYLNEEWNSNDGGVFLYKDDISNEIRGIEPKYNSMVVNYITEFSPHNLHCVTCIIPGTVKKRLTIQWRTSKDKSIYYDN